MDYSKLNNVLGLLRLSMGWIFLWAFIDKVFGLGFSTVHGKAWINGVSPTLGFLKFGSKGLFSSFYHTIAGNIIIDWIFMAGLLLIGITLILGIATRISVFAGALIVFLMWTAVLPPQNNPILDEHIIYILVFIILGIANSGNYIGFGKEWSNTSLVKNYPILK